MKKPGIMETIDPDLTEHIMSRREAMNGVGKWTSKIALASLPLGFAALTKSVFAAHLPSQVVDVLNFALTLEYLEAEYYIMGVASGIIPGADRKTFVTIRDHEIAHVDYLKRVLGAAAVAKPAFDFTAGGAFAPFTNYETFKLLAQGFEDTGVRAYKGQFPALQPYDQVLTAAATIHSVEGRHASMVRRLRGLEGWIPFAGSDSPAALMAIYAGEDNTTHAGVSVPSITSIALEEITESFDEPLTKAEVVAIITPFLA